MAVWNAGRSAATRCIGQEVDSARSGESDWMASRATRAGGWVGDAPEGKTGPEGMCGLEGTVGPEGIAGPEGVSDESESKKNILQEQ